MLGTSTHSSHRSMHINTDREQHIHPNRNRHMCRHTGYRCRRPKGLVATDTWWYYLNSCSHLCIKRYLFIGLPGSKSWRCLSPLGLVNAKSSWSCPNLCHPMNYITGQASLSMGFSRQGYRSGLPLPPPEDLLKPWMEGVSLTSLALADRFFFFFLTTGAIWTWSPKGYRIGLCFWLHFGHSTSSETFVSLNLDFLIF